MPPIHWSRREFLSAISGAGAAVALNPLSAWAIDDIDPKVARIVAATMGIDTHNHVDVPLADADFPGPDLDISGEMKRSGLSAICMTFAVDYQPLSQPGEAYERFRNGIACIDHQLALNSMKRALGMQDLRASHTKRQPAVIQSVEGGHFLEGQIDRLREAYGRGLRHLTLLHDSDASVPLGDVYTNPPRYGGLTSFGSEVIKECNWLGILVDMAHANEETLRAAVRQSGSPLMISHTGLDTQPGKDPRLASMMRPRLISKKQAKMFAHSGGVIGVWTHLSDTPLEYAQNIRAMVEVAGIDHVCIGTDTKLTPSNRDPKHQRPGERTNEAWPDERQGFYYVVVDAMLKIGFSEDEIGKIGGGNFCRVFEAATAGGR